MAGPISTSVKVILFDYGGVLAEEGFREGLMAIACANGLLPQGFFEMATATVYESGYVVGTADEHSYWDLLRQRSGIEQSDAELRKEILDRFILRSWMLEIVCGLRRRGYFVGILSDQTQWLDELDARDHFFAEFNVVFNSYHLGRGKKDPQVFDEVAERALESYRQRFSSSTTTTGTLKGPSPEACRPYSFGTRIRFCEK